MLNNSCTNDDSSNTPNTVNTVKDIDGNVYHTVTIGTQVWMVENLKVSKYRNGDPIPNITDTTEWYKLSTGAYCYYENNASYSSTYGKLYNWYAVKDSRNLAPEGWRVATDADWTILTDLLGIIGYAGDKLKEKGIVHWNDPNTGATNETGFTALPGGERTSSGTFEFIGKTGFWWTSTENNTYYSYYRSMFNLYNYVNRVYIPINYGLSVRCIKE